MNPVVREAAGSILGDSDRVRIIEPLEVIDFHNFLSRSYLILTDSGGIQEEAPSLGKLVLVMHDTTERPENEAAGTLELVGTNKETIYQAFKSLLENEAKYEQMSQASNPYGDGLANKRIEYFRNKIIISKVAFNNHRMLKKFINFDLIIIVPAIRYRAIERVD